MLTKLSIKTRINITKYTLPSFVLKRINRKARSIPKDSKASKKNIKKNIENLEKGIRYR
jgi:hypothetical protein